MDSSVLAAIARWPSVPAVYGWLGLTARGEWRIRGEPIANAAIREFIGRNYAGDERGCWYFQNGPQRVYVELEATPWIWRLDVAGKGEVLQAHTGARPKRLGGAWLDEQGRLYLETELGCGLVDSRDIERVWASSGVGPVDHNGWTLDAGPRVNFEGTGIGLRGRAEIGRLRAVDVPGRFGFSRSPRAP